ncbi:MAG: hypothetical protein JSV88_07305 [Candidatus Aminicenantes bacterium]|nr:MAG: hypothetical protein JSV88_07305 [Candidatus Aminicenantes bacterium]
MYKRYKMYLNKKFHLAIITILLFLSWTTGSVIHGSPKPQNKQIPVKTGRIKIFEKEKVTPGEGNDESNHNFNWYLLDFLRKEKMQVFIAGDPKEKDKWAVDDGIEIEITNDYIEIGIEYGYSRDNINKAGGFIPENVRKNAKDITYIIPSKDDIKDKNLIEITITFELMDTGKVKGNTDIFILKMKGKSIIERKRIFTASGPKEYNETKFNRHVTPFNRTKGEKIFISGSREKMAKWAVDALLIKVAKRYRFPGITGNYPRNKKYIPDGVKQDKLEITGIIPENKESLLVFELFDKGGVSGNTDIYLLYYEY